MPKQFATAMDEVGGERALPNNSRQLPGPLPVMGFVRARSSGQSEDNDVTRRKRESNSGENATATGFRTIDIGSVAVRRERRQRGSAAVTAIGFLEAPEQRPRPWRRRGSGSVSLSRRQSVTSSRNLPNARGSG